MRGDLAVLDVRGKSGVRCETNGRIMLGMKMCSIRIKRWLRGSAKRTKRMAEPLLRPTALVNEEG
jgi:hypothetical protein